MASAAARQPSNARPAPASSRELLGTFQPGSEAEPPGLEPPPADTTPTVLNKLQKWVRRRRRRRRRRPQLPPPPDLPIWACLPSHPAQLGLLGV